MAKHGTKRVKTVEHAEKNHEVNPIKNEVVGICVISFAVLLAVFMITDKAGKVGIIIKDIFLSILGVGTYIMPIFILIYGVSLILNKTKEINKKKIIWLTMVMVSFVTLDHIFYQHFSNIPWTYDLKRIYTDSIHGSGGGIIGGLIAITLYKMFYIYGAIIISITMFTIFMMLAADVSILLGFKKIITYFIALFKNRSQNAKSEYQLANTIDNTIEKPRNRKNVIVNLNDEDQENEVIDDELCPDKIKIIDSKLDEKINIISQLQDNKGNNLNAKSNELSNQNENRKRKSKNENIPKMDIDMLKNVTSNKAYIAPSVEMLNNAKHEVSSDENKEILQNAKKLEETLQSFGVSAKVLQVSKGPTVTRYEIQPSHGVKVSRIVNLADDIALNLAAPTVRIEAPIPGKSAVGIEIPNKDMRGVLFREVIQTSEFQNSQSKVTFAVGMDIEGKPIVSDIAKMPHLLIAGATGSGKSVCINTIIASILYKASPEEVKIIMIDPKVVELNVYNGIPHLMIPVVTDPKKAASALNWAVQEMLNRYNLFAQTGTRDIKGYNSYIKDKEALEGEEFTDTSEIDDDFDNNLDDVIENSAPRTVLKPMSQIVIIIDELADLMMAAPNEVEDAICRLAQMARAAGMHLIIATQRPSVDVITGVIKANIPSRIAFAVSSQVDSRTILDMSGAEKLLGKGDMLFYPIGKSKPIRVQGPFISDKEVENIVEFIKQQNKVSYDEDVIEKITNTSSGAGDSTNSGGDADELLPQAIDIIMETQQASISMLQRRLRIGFSRAARIIDQMEARELVGPPEGSKPRKVLFTKAEYEQMKNSMED